MASLLQVLHDATGQGATEIVIEPGRSPTMRTTVGVETMPTVLSESALFDALGGVLGPDQQGELAVGNVVEFQLHDGLVRWHLAAQAGNDGVVVRGRTTPTAHGVAEIGTPLDLPRLAPSEGDAVSIPSPPPRRHRDTAWDLPSVALTPPPSAGGAIPEWLVSTAPAVRTAADAPDFALRRPPTGEPPATLGDAFDLHRSGSPGARAIDPFIALAAGLPEGSLCLVRGHGQGERLARCLGAYALILEPAEAIGRRFEGHLAAFVLRVDDPSELLGWSLTRVEEGGRVIVELGVRTADAGRRVLLGVRHGATAVEWLHAVPTFWVAEQNNQWALTRV